MKGWRTRRLIAKLDALEPDPEDILAASEHGRSAIQSLFRHFGESRTPEIRSAAGLALSTLWFKDELIAEEEQALVRRGYEVTWHARRRYPRALSSTIPISVSYGLPHLANAAGKIKAENLEWSHRLVGTRRIAMEEFSDWRPGNGRADFEIVPGDFDGSGPHRIALAVKVRTAGLSSSWTIDLPQSPFNIEFDPRLSVDSLLASPDDTRSEVIGRAIRLEVPRETDEASPSYVRLGESFAIRPCPHSFIAGPLPCDLAHRVTLEFEGSDLRHDARPLVMACQGVRGEQAHPRVIGRHAIENLSGPVPEVLQNPGPARIRVCLEPDPAMAWNVPEIRSVWPNRMVTNWIDVDIVRR